MVKKQAKKELPEWDQVLSAACHLQRIFPDAVVVGGTAAAIYARHRLSVDADHVLPDLKDKFDEVLEQLESVSGWKTARVKRPVLILGSLDGIETGIRQLRREQPLEKIDVDHKGLKVQVPTMGEILRIKGSLILQRNATRDYLDFCAMADHLGKEETQKALEPFDDLYRSVNGASALQQLAIQLAAPFPGDLKETDLTEYKKLVPAWHDWSNVARACQNLSTDIMSQLKQDVEQPADRPQFERQK